MTEVPKIVHDRLRAISSSGSSVHPENDVLAAFVEQTLSVAEREGVLAHLALCANCREIVALAFPVVDAAIQSTVPEPTVASISRNAFGGKSRSFFAWPTMRWAALAGACAMVAVVLVVKKLEFSTPPSNNTLIATNIAPAPSTSANPVASLPPNSSAGASPGAPDQTSSLQVPTPIHKKNAQASTKASVAASREPYAFASYGNGGSAYVAPPPGAASSTSSSPPISARNETVEVSSADTAVNTEPATGQSVAGGSVAGIVRAKPVPQELETIGGPVQKKEGETVMPTLQGRNFTSLQVLSLDGNLPARQANLMINADGALQRSLDDGKTWQVALRADSKLLCYTTRGPDVWVGGQAGLLYHSADQGTTWERVKPNFGGNALTTDVIHIGLSRAKAANTASQGAMTVSNIASASIIISTANNQVWTSADGGKTWTMQ
jgi:hypothetical protein